MNQTVTENDHGAKCSKNCKFSHRTRCFLTVIFLVGLGVLIGMSLATSKSAQAFPSDMDHWRHFHRTLTMADLQERASDRVAWVAGTVDATAEQKAQMQQIIQELSVEIFPIIQQHRQNRQTFFNELANSPFNRNSLEELRKAEVALIDQGTQRIANGFADVLEVLTPEQRLLLKQRADKMRH